MIDTISITNFKSHINLNLDFKLLTLLVGTNSSGKSSVIQAILLAVHNITNQGASPLNGHLVSVGTFEDAASFISNAHQFKIVIKSTNDNHISLEFNKSEDSKDGNVNITKDAEIEKMLNYNDNHIHYLSAKRIGAQDIHLKNYDRYDQYGVNGEFVIDYFESHKSKILEKRLISEDSSYTLESQVNYWLKRITNHALETSDILGTSFLQARYRVRSEDSLLISKVIKPANTGSGVSYVLSIIIICLSSNKGDIVIIENPEIHLHPVAQALLIEFFVFISNYGIQLIIETHSDHIFNGVRVQINNNKISTNNVSINFFTKDEESLESSHTKINISEIGRVLNHQELLFDQFDIDTNSLLGI